MIYYGKTVHILTSCNIEGAFMKKLQKMMLSVVLLAIAGCCCRQEEASYPETIDEGFVSIFNGKDLTKISKNEMYSIP